MWCIAIYYANASIAVKIFIKGLNMLSFIAIYMGSMAKRKSLVKKAAQRPGKRAPAAAPKTTAEPAPAPPTASLKPSIIAFELPLRPHLPTIVGSVDYRDYCDQLCHLDGLLVQSGLEEEIMQERLQQWIDLNPERPLSPRLQRRLQNYARQAVRCNIARVLLKEDFRGFAVRLAESPVLQRFCGLSQIAQIKVPAKSTFHRMAAQWDEPTVRGWMMRLLVQGYLQPEKLGLDQPLDLEMLLSDTCCVEANIHYPTDWVLFRDGTRTLMRAVSLIRQEGLKHRMPEPKELIRQMNRLCIAMSQARAKDNPKRARKRILRRMDRLMGTVSSHAHRYRKLLDEQWQKTQWTRAQAEQVLRRLDNVLEQLPAARRQARQRILKELAVENKDKILSFYEKDIHVIVRHKAGAEVEFGNKLFLGESAQGLIIDWKLFKDTVPADNKLVRGSLERIQSALGPVLKAMAGDRGFHSQSNEAELKKRKIYDALCPRQPQALKERGQSPKFKKLQRRRAQTEGRIAIFTRCFLGEPLRSKGFEHRESAVTWGVMVHNLWVLSRMRAAAAKAAEAVAATKAAA